MSKKKLHIIVNQHMDLVWRRCFERDIEFGGQNFVSYADLEEIFIKDNRSFCERYPEYRGEGGKLTIRVPSCVTAACETDLKEDPIGTADLSDGCIRSQIKPFEIKTFCLQF